MEGFLTGQYFVLHPFGGGKLFLIFIVVHAPEEEEAASSAGDTDANTNDMTDNAIIFVFVTMVLLQILGL